MPTGQISRGLTAHVEATITNAHPDAAFGRDSTGRVRGRLAIYGPGEP